MDKPAKRVPKYYEDGAARELRAILADVPMKPPATGTPAAIHVHVHLHIHESKAALKGTQKAHRA